ncbi:MAG: hypothetical protein KAT71_01920 [Gammaproteobacteria bacterium]|nr:hypothetical protein [Gammaproteobacteria bacterium]
MKDFLEQFFKKIGKKGKDNAVDIISIIGAILSGIFMSVPAVFPESGLFTAGISIVAVLANTGLCFVTTRSKLIQLIDLRKHLHIDSSAIEKISIATNAGLLYTTLITLTGYCIFVFSPVTPYVGVPIAIVTAGLSPIGRKFVDHFLRKEIFNTRDRYLVEYFTPAQQEKFREYFVDGQNVVVASRLFVDAFLQMGEEPDQGSAAAEIVAPEDPVFRRGYFHDREFIFAEHPIAGEGARGDCGFTALGVDRDRAIGALLAQARDPVIRQIVAPEIVEAFRAHNLPEALRSEEEVRQLYERYGINSDALIPALTAWSEREEVFVVFVRDYLSEFGRQWLTFMPGNEGGACGILDAIMLGQGIPGICIWATDARGQMREQPSHYYGDIERATHILWTSGNHFNFLVPLTFMEIQERDQLRQEHDRLQGDLHITMEESRAAQAGVIRLRGERNYLRRQLHRSQAESARHQQEVKRLTPFEEGYRESQAALRTEQESHRTEREAHARTRDLAEERGRQIERLERDLGEVRHNLTEKQRELELMEIERDEISRRLATQIEAVSTLEKRLGLLTEELAGARRDAEEKQAEIDMAGVQAEQARRGIEGLRDQLSVREQELAPLQQEVTRLQGELRAIISTRDGNHARDLSRLGVFSAPPPDGGSHERLDRDDGLSNG